MSPKVSLILILWLNVTLNVVNSFYCTTTNHVQSSNQRKIHVKMQHRFPSNHHQTAQIQMMSIDSILPTIASLSAVTFVTAFHEAGHFLAAKVQNITVQSFNVGYGPKLIAFNDTQNIEYAFRLIPLGGYVAFPANVITDDNGEIIGENTDDMNLLQNRPALQRAFVISGGVLANILLTFLISAGLAVNPGINRPLFDTGIVVSSRVADSPGTLAGIQISDVITKINGYEVQGSASAVPEFVKRVQNTPEGELLSIELQRSTVGSSGSSTSVNTVSSPALPSTSAVNSNIVKKQVIQLTIDPNRGLTGKATIGIGVSANIKSNSVVKASSLLEAATIGSQETVNMIKTISSGLASAAATGFTGAEVGGPISVIKAGANAAQYDSVAILGFASFLSINLAILNSLPLPALDGGQLLFVMIELLSGGKKIPRDIQAGLIGMAFSFLLVVSASTFVNDLTHLNDPTPPRFVKKVDKALSSSGISGSSDASSATSPSAAAAVVGGSNSKSTE